MKVEIWSDYACPYCYIGKRHLEQALAGTRYSAEVEVVFRAFELDRTASRHVINTTQQRIEHKYGRSPDSARGMIDHIMAMGARAGLDMHYDTVRYTNTFDAHRLTCFAQTKGSASVVSERLFRAYFTENRELADHAVLLDIAMTAGLDEAETRLMLNSDAFSVQVREDEAQAERLGIHAVPCFVLEDGTQLSGAQPAAALLSALEDRR